MRRLRSKPGGQDCAPCVSQRLAAVAVLLMCTAGTAGAGHGELKHERVRSATPATTLTVSGFLSMGLMAWDDRAETGSAIVDNGEQNSRLTFSGAARFGGGWSAGFDMEFGLSGNFAGAGGVPSSNCVDQDSADCGPLTPVIRTEQIWLAHRRLGKLQVGFASPPSRLVKNFAGRIAGTHFWGMDSSPQVGMNLLVRAAGANAGRLRWRHVIDGRVGPFREQVAWTSPLFAGVSLSAGAGTDDHWDVALYMRRADLAGFKVFGAAAVLRDRTPAAGLEFSELKGSLGAMHLASGLFAWSASARRNYDEIDSVANPGGWDWYIQAGLKRPLWTIGPTAFAIDYGNHADIRAGLSLPATSLTVESSQARFFGAGLTQWIDAAATELYVGWRRYDAEPLHLGNGDRLAVRDLDVFISGMRIKF
jgi:hypothetical protein